MAGEVFIARQDTLDIVKQDTTFIKGQFPISGGTDWSKYKPISSGISANNTDSFTTEFSVDGEGYIGDVQLIANNSWSTCYIEFYIDGVLLYSGSSYNDNAGGGNSSGISMTNGDICTLPALNLKNKLRILTYLFFKKNCTIKIKGSAGHTHYLDILGGVKA